MKLSAREELVNEIRTLLADMTLDELYEFNRQIEWHTRAKYRELTIELVTEAILRITRKRVS